MNTRITDQCKYQIDFDLKGYKKIQISKIPDLGSGVAINDRIQRASKS